MSQPQQQPQAQQSRRDGDLLNMFGKRRKLTRVEEKEMDDSVVDFICIDMRPFAVVDGDGFKRMMNKVSQGSYTIKTRSTYHSMAAIAYRKAVRSLKALMSGIKDVCITTDLWTSMYNLETYL